MVKRGKQSKRRGATKAPLSEPLLREVAQRFRTLGSLSRLKVLNALMPGPLGMAGLMEATGLEQSNLSRHVRELERAGCIGRERRGRSVHVAIVDPTLMELCELMCGSLVEQAADQHRRLSAS